MPKEEFYSDRPAASLSGGERIKLQLGRLLFSRPAALLLDEPSSDLDLETLEWLGGFIGRFPRGHILRLTIEPPAHGHHRVHLLFQQATAAGVLAGDNVLGVLHALLDAAVFLQLFIVLLPLLPGLPGLVRNGLRPAADIGGIIQPVDRASGRLPLSGILHGDPGRLGYLAQDLGEEEKAGSVYDFCAASPDFFDMTPKELADIARGCSMWSTIVAVFSMSVSS